MKSEEIGHANDEVAFGWNTSGLSGAVQINPKRKLEKGMPSKKVSMDDLSPFTREVTHFEMARFRGGSKFQNGDTLMARITPCLENGKTAFVDILQENEVGHGSTEFIVLCGKEGITTNEFVYYLIRSPKVRKEAIKSMTGTSGRQRVQTDSLGEIEIAYPPFDEQVQVTKILTDLDSKIELNQRMNRTLEAIANAIFKSWFVDFDPVRAKAEGRWKKGESLPGMPADMWDLWPSEFGESEIGEIPKGWEVSDLGNVATCPRDLIDPSNLDPEERYVGLEHITPRSLSLWRWGRAGDTVSVKARFRLGEILFGKLRPYFHKVCIPSFEGVASTDILTVAPKSSDWFGFVLGHLNSTELVEYATAASNGTKMPRTSWEDLAHWQVAMPPVDLSRSLSEKLQPLFAKLGETIKESSALASARDALLPRLITGKIRVRLEDTDV